MNRLFGIATLCVGIWISGVAGYFSIVGLAALFAARALPVIIMGTSLEIGKLVAATWLKLNWGNRLVPRLHKGYLLFAVASLMAITMIGIFGFLSAGHLEQNAPLAGIAVQAQQYQTRLDQTNATNVRINGRLAQIDQNINAFLTNGSATKGLAASATLKKERETLQAQLDANNVVVNDLNTKLAPLKSQSLEVEAKLGPIKYLAEFFGAKDPETAVRIVIVIIMLSFDMLAVVLILSGMMTLRQKDEITEPVVPEVIAAPQDAAKDSPVKLADIGVFGELDAPRVELLRTVSGDLTVPIGVAATMTAEEPKPVIPGRFAVGEALTVPIEAFGSIETKEPVVEPTEAVAPVVEAEASPENIRTHILDLMEQYPSIVTDLLEAAKEMDANKSEAVEQSNNSETNNWLKD